MISLAISITFNILNFIENQSKKQIKNKLNGGMINMHVLQMEQEGRNVHPVLRRAVDNVGVGHTVLAGVDGDTSRVRVEVGSKDQLKEKLGEFPEGYTLLLRMYRGPGNIPTDFYGSRSLIASALGGASPTVRKYVPPQHFW